MVQGFNVWKVIFLLWQQYFEVKYWPMVVGVMFGKRFSCYGNRFEVLYFEVKYCT